MEMAMTTWGSGELVRQERRGRCRHGSSLERADRPQRDLIPYHWRGRRDRSARCHAEERAASDGLDGVDADRFESSARVPTAQAEPVMQQAEFDTVFYDYKARGITIPWSAARA